MTRECARQPQESADPRRWTALAVLSVAQFMLILDLTVVNVALPELGADLDLSRRALTWTASAHPDRAARRLDVLGAVTVTGANGSFIYGMLKAGDTGWADLGTLLPIAAATVLYGVFVVVERTARAPLMRLSLLSRRPVAAGAFWMLVASGVLIAGLFLGSQYLQRSRFLALRVRPAGITPRRQAAAHAGGARWELPVRWLLAEWPADKPEPVKYWLSNLPEATRSWSWCGWAARNRRRRPDLWQLLGELQALLACWAGASPLVSLPRPVSPAGSATEDEPARRPDRALLGGVMQWPVSVGGRW